MAKSTIILADEAADARRDVPGLVARGHLGVEMSYGVRSPGSPKQCRAEAKLGGPFVKIK